MRGPSGMLPIIIPLLMIATAPQVVEGPGFTAERW
jgi:hypothetical protein